MMEEKKYYLTKEGVIKLEKEYKDLVGLKLTKTKGEESPKVLQSEDLNPEYLAFQEDVSFLESRIAELDNILKNVSLIRTPKHSDKNKIGLGAKVTVDANGQKNEFTLVGSLEANPIMGRISDESPVGKALLGHQIGDKVEISAPAKITYKIKRIDYKIA
jgi:transcription elongation factor GreA